jgi:predicted nucleic acid-binding protein
VIKPLIADTGVIVAFLDKRDAWNIWTTEQMRRLPVPFLTCEAVIVEACFLTAHLQGGKENVLKLVSSGVLQIDFSLQTEIEAVERLIKKYADVPMDLADACLVRMSELTDNATVFTLDSDFYIYRKNGEKKISLIIPS